MTLSRRQLLRGGAALAALAGCEYAGRGDAAVHSDPAVVVTQGSFVSAARAGARTGWTLAVPRGTSAAIPLVVVLHGRGGDHTTAFAALRFDTALAAVVQAGAAPIAVASVDGGDHSYYHRRADGTDAGVMVMTELPAALREHVTLLPRIGLMGWSMGGYGALRTAARYGPTRVAAVAVSSAALWRRWQDSAPRAFDGPRDFAANSVLDRLDALNGIRLRVVCGAQDPFIATNRELARRVPGALHAFPPGGHSNSFWRATDDAQLAFLAGALHA